MLSKNCFDIESFCVNTASRPSNKPLPRPPLHVRSRRDLSKSFESLAESFEEIDIPSSSLRHDPEIDRLMSPAGSYRKSRYEVNSYTSTFRARSPVFHVTSDRDSFESIYDDFGIGLPQLCQQHPDERPQPLRPGSLLPAAPFEYNQLSYCRDSDNTALYSAQLRSSLSSSYQLAALQRNQSFAKRSVTPLQLENLCSHLDGGIFSNQASDYSYKARSSTLVSYPAPSLSFSSTTESSLSSIVTDTSSQDMGPSYGTVEHVEQPKGKESKIQAKCLALCDTQTRANAGARNISPPIPSPTLPDANSAAAFSCHRTPSSRSYAPTPSPAPTLTNEVSSFDFDSDDEEGRISYHLKAIPKSVKSAVSFQNLRKESRGRAESASRTSPIPTAPIVVSERTSHVNMGRNSKEGKQSTIPALAVAVQASPATATRVTSSGTAQMSYHSTSSNHNRASSEFKPSSPIAKLQEKVSVGSKRGNTVKAASSPPSPPPNTPLPPIPTLAAERQSRISWYSCFSRADNTVANNCIANAQKKCRSKSSKSSTRPTRPSKIRVLMRRFFRFKK